MHSHDKEWTTPYTYQEPLGCVILMNTAHKTVYVVRSSFPLVIMTNIIK